MTKKVLICPNCKGFSVHRKKGCCIHCKQPIITGNNIVGRGDYYWNKKKDIFLSYGQIKTLDK